MVSNPPSAPDSRSGTPGATPGNRFTGQQQDAEDVLKSQTVGLVNLSDYRKRRVEAIEQTTRLPVDSSGASTPREGALTPQPAKKKSKKNKSKGKLSFLMDEEEEDFASVGATPNISKSSTPIPQLDPATAKDADAPIRKRLGPNSTISGAPKVMTKSALLKEAQTREQLRKDFLNMQESVKATEMIIPYMLYDGAAIPGGQVRVKKGDHVWLFLDKARKAGAEMGDSARKGWARISVDDLMLVKDDIIIPPHFEFYYFMVNKSVGFNGRLFDYSAEPTKCTPKLETEEEVDANYDPMAPRKKKDKTSQFADEELEGFDDDASETKVVDRRWYEKNKHIFPASLWEEFDPTKDYATALRKDAAGNILFTTR
ncbi:XAP5-domain-containing protein [Microthyrium microscopicum]|uniref:XAP5-domain-containing protein n=1 Tax=Microthyrium microscopicum TaxID=703497 RepID=A0A6A6U5E9_9PEZI|nr:XAP5-domain-containing protein [Microthyrium microscopicum]